MSATHARPAPTPSHATAPQQQQLSATAAAAQRAAWRFAGRYDTLKSKANLEYRLGFARRVLRAELFAIRALGHEAAAKRLRVGDLEQSSVLQTEQGPGGGLVVREQWYFTYVEVGRNAEGRKIQDGEDIFADLSGDDDEEVQAPLEESSNGFRHSARNGRHSLRKSSASGGSRKSLYSSLGEGSSFD
jgi:hypothetical protein